MNLIFLKALLRAIKMDLDIIFIDETSCCLQNNNYKDWVSDKEECIKGPGKGLKGKLNIIMAVNMKKIVYYEILNSNVNSKNFSEFFEYLSKKLSTEKTEKTRY